MGRYSISILDGIYISATAIHRRSVMQSKVHPGFHTIVDTRPASGTSRIISDSREFKVSVGSADVERESRTFTDSDETSQIILEQVSSQPYTLSYACLVIPRFNTHYLVGDLAELLYHQMKKICISFGWRLEYIDIRPEYLQWIMTVHASTSPSTFMRTILQQTSTKILKEFPRIRRENSSTQFWAPGYLALVGTQPYPPEMIKDFIRLTRQQQGLPFD